MKQEYWAGCDYRVIDEVSWTDEFGLHLRKLGSPIFAVSNHSCDGCFYYTQCQVKHATRRWLYSRMIAEHQIKLLQEMYARNQELFKKMEG